MFIEQWRGRFCRHCAPCQAPATSFLLLYSRVSVARVTRPSGAEPELVLASVWLQSGIRGALGLKPRLGGCRVLGGIPALSPGGLEAHLALPPLPIPMSCVSRG